MSNDVEIIITGDDRSAAAFISATSHVREYRREAENAGSAAAAAIDDISDSADLAVVFLQQLQQEFISLLQAAEAAAGGGPAAALEDTAEAAVEAEQAAEEAATEVVEALEDIADASAVATAATEQLGESVEDVNAPAELAATAAALDEVGDQAHQAAEAVEDIGQEAVWSRVRGFVSRLIPDMNDVRTSARSIGTTLTEGVFNLTDRLPLGIAGAIRATGPAGAAVAATVGVTIGGVLVSAIAGVLAGGAGAAGIGVGIAAAMKDAKVQEAASDLKDTMSREFADIGQVFAGPVSRAMKTLQTAFSGADFSNMLSSLIGAIEPLANGIVGMLEAMIPGMTHLFQAGGELLAGMSDDFVNLGETIGDFVDRIAAVGPAGQSSLEMLLVAVGWIVDILGLAIEGLGEMWQGVVKLADAVGLIDADSVAGSFERLLLPVDSNALAFHTLAENTKQAAEAQEAAQKAADELHSSLTGLFDGAIAAQEAMWALEDSVKENGTSLDYTTKKGMENVKAISAMVSAAEQQAEAARASSIASGDAANAEANATRVRNEATAKIIEQAAAMGLDQWQVRNLINTLQGLPTGDRYLNYTVRTTYQVQRDQAEQRDRGSGYAGQAQAAGMSTGGQVTGSGTGTSDSELRRLSVDEHVMTSAEVSAAGGHRSVYNLRRALLSGNTRQSMADVMAGGGGSGGGGGATYVINTYSLDPSSAGDLIVKALESWTQSNGTLPTGWVAA